MLPVVETVLQHRGHLTHNVLARTSRCQKKGKKIEYKIKQSPEHKGSRSSTSAKNQKSGPEKEYSSAEQSHHKTKRRMSKAPEAQPPANG
ncbi:hypothetical protein YC2023_017867 [Brassica napus]